MRKLVFILWLYVGFTALEVNMTINVDELRERLSEHDEKTGHVFIDAQFFVSSFFKYCNFENLARMAREDTQRNIPKIGALSDSNNLPNYFNMLRLYAYHIKLFSKKHTWNKDYTEIMSTLELCLRMHGVTKENRERIVVHHIPEFKEFSQKLRNLKSISVLEAIRENMFAISAALFGDSDKQIKFLDLAKHQLFWDVFTKDILPLLRDNMNKPPTVSDSIDTVNLRCDIHFLIYIYLCRFETDSSKLLYMDSKEYCLFNDTLDNIYSPESLASLHSMIKTMIENNKDNHEAFWLSFTTDVISSAKTIAEQDKQLLTEDECPAVTLPGNSAIGGLLTAFSPYLNAIDAILADPIPSPEQSDPDTEDSSATQPESTNKRETTLSKNRVAVELLTPLMSYAHSRTGSLPSSSRQSNANAESSSATQPESTNKQKANVEDNLATQPESTNKRKASDQSCSDNEEQPKKQRLGL